MGKTTSAVNLSAYLVDAGCDVLLVDSDPQANATTSLGIDPRAPGTSLYDVLIDHAPVYDAVTPTAQPDLDLLPANLDLAGAEVPPRLQAQLQFWENRFRDRLSTKLSLERKADGSGRLVIHFYSDDDLETIYREIIGDEAD